MSKTSTHLPSDMLHQYRLCRCICESHVYSVHESVRVQETWRCGFGVMAGKKNILYLEGCFFGLFLSDV